MILDYVLIAFIGIILLLFVGRGWSRSRKDKR